MNTQNVFDRPLFLRLLRLQSGDQKNLRDRFRWLFFEPESMYIGVTFLENVTPYGWWVGRNRISLFSKMQNLTAANWQNRVEVIGCDLGCYYSLGLQCSHQCSRFPKCSITSWATRMELARSQRAPSTCWNWMSLLLQSSSWIVVVVLFKMTNTDDGYIAAWGDTDVKAQGIPITPSALTYVRGRTTLRTSVCILAASLPDSDDTNE